MTKTALTLLLGIAIGWSAAGWFISRDHLPLPEPEDGLVTFLPKNAKLVGTPATEIKSDTETEIFMTSACTEGDPSKDVCVDGKAKPYFDTPAPYVPPLFLDE